MASFQSNAFKAFRRKERFCPFLFGVMKNQSCNGENSKRIRIAQKKGRQEVFENYRLRIAKILRDYGLNERDQAPEDSKDYH